MKQSTLFDNDAIRHPRKFTNANARALARRHGPETSRVAAQEIAPRVNSMQSVALHAVGRYPGRTYTELSRVMGHSDPRTLGRRLGELANLGLVVRGEVRRCEVTGRKCTVYSVSEAIRG